MGGDEGVDEAVVFDLGHAAAVLHKVAGGHAGDDGEFFGRVVLPVFFAHGVQNAVRRGKRAKPADSNGHTILNEVHRLID